MTDIRFSTTLIGLTTSKVVNGLNELFFPTLSIFLDMV